MQFEKEWIQAVVGCKRSGSVGDAVFKNWKLREARIRSDLLFRSAILQTWVTHRPTKLQAPKRSRACITKRLATYQSRSKPQQYRRHRWEKIYTSEQNPALPPETTIYTGTAERPTPIPQSLTTLPPEAPNHRRRCLLRPNEELHYFPTAAKDPTYRKVKPIPSICLLLYRRFFLHHT